MVDIRNINSVYFIGIGGIGMSALARYFSFHGKSVAGYDKTSTVLTRQLAAEGIAVHYEDNPDLVSKDADIVVYTPAIPSNHKELNYFRENNYTILKRSDVLGIITNGSFNICVAGTHGKTTISTMIAHILRDSGFGCNAFLGGIASNYDSNYWSDKNNVCVVEADEYDRSFLKLNPDIAVISAMDADHLDIYGSEESMKEAFYDFSGKIKPGGTLLYKAGLPGSFFKSDRNITYGTDDNADVKVLNIEMIQGIYRFAVTAADWKLDDIILNMGGMHNVENMTAAVYIAHVLGVPDEDIRKAVASFRGVKRRFEYIFRRISVNDELSLLYIDDYAHHPEELRALINGARELFSDMECTIIFQPHLFSRTRDFADGFASVLDIADNVVLLPVYPARELPIEGVNSEMVLEKMKNPSRQIIEKGNIIDYIKSQFINKPAGRKMLITAGAGDIDTLVQPIKQLLENEG